MAKEEAIRVTGTVIEVLPNATFRIELENAPNSIIGYISGKMRQFNIVVAIGDTVEVDMSPYDLSKGRVVRRR